MSERETLNLANLTAGQIRYLRYKDSYDRYAKKRQSDPVLRERRNAQTRMSQKRNALRLREYDKSRDPIVISARAAIRQRVWLGTIKRQVCEVCGSVNAQAHHDDYSKPLDVRWLCAVHHAEVHKEKKRLI